MIKKMLLVCLLILLISLISCVQKVTEKETVVENITEVTQEPEKIILPSGKCEVENVCISSKVSATRNSDCEFVDRITCETECEDGLCKEKEITICTSGFKCKNDLERSFQRESCQWEKREICEFGCDINLNRCHTAATNNETEISSDNEIPVIVKNPTISFGNSVEIGGDNFSIYVIESERVRLKLGQQRSDWLSDGSSVIFNDGVNITVVAILYQPYQGGKRDIIYKVN